MLMYILGFLIGALIIFVICIAFDYYKYKKHFNNLFHRYTRIPIKINKRVIRYVLSESYFDKIGVLIFNLVLASISVFAFLNIITLENYNILVAILVAVLCILFVYETIKYALPIIKNEIKYFKNNYYFLEDEITEEQEDDAGIESDFFVHFKKCLVPTQVTAKIADSTTVGDQVYILVISNNLYVFSKKYYTLEDTSLIKEKYEPTSSIEGSK